jgi:hypothetical protein
MENQVDLQDCLISIKQIPGVLGGILIRKSGELVGHTFEDSELLKKITQLTRDYTQFMRALGREGRTGPCQSILIKGDFGVVDIFVINSRKLINVTLGTDSMNIGLLRATLDEELSKFE